MQFTSRNIIIQLSALLWICFPFASPAQLHLDTLAPYNDPLVLARDVLGGGTAEMSNASSLYSDWDLGFVGRFEDIAPFGLGIDSGVYLYTHRAFIMLNGLGNISVLDYIASSANASSSLWGQQIQAPNAPIDSQLLEIYNASTLNSNPTLTPELYFRYQSVMQFDWVADRDTITIPYIFADEDHNCTGPPNGMGIFIAGVNPSGGTYDFVNTALIPSNAAQTTFHPYGISTNSLNDGVSLGPWFEPYCDAANPFWQTPLNISFMRDNSNNAVSALSFEYISKVLYARLPIVCGETYTIKLGLYKGASDNSNYSLRPAAFFAANTFAGRAYAPVASSAQNSDPVEGCSPVSLTFARPSFPKYAPGTGDLEVFFSLGGTATLGQDYSFSNSPYIDRVVIPDSDSLFTLSIEILDDAISEGTETLEFTIEDLQYGPSCSGDSAQVVVFSIYEEENTMIALSAAGTIACQGDSVLLTATVSGGNPEEQSIQWAVEGDPIAHENLTLWVMPEQTTEYSLTVYGCKDTLTQSVSVDVPLYEELLLDTIAHQFLCDESLTTLDANTCFSGGKEPLSIAWYNATTGALLSSEESATLPSGNFTLSIQDACGQSIEDNFTLWDYRIPAQNLEITVGEGFSPEYTFEHSETLLSPHTDKMDISYFWNFGDGTFSEGFGDKTHLFEAFGSFFVTLTARNEQGCEEQIQIPISLQPSISAPNALFAGSPEDNGAFFLVAPKTYLRFQLQIFSRWGEKVFQANSIDTPWKGKDMEQQRVSAGVYVYKYTIFYKGIPPLEGEGTVYVEHVQ